MPYGYLSLVKCNYEVTFQPKHDSLLRDKEVPKIIDYNIIHNNLLSYLIFRVLLRKKCILKTISGIFHSHLGKRAPMKYIVLNILRGAQSNLLQKILP